MWKITDFCFNLNKKYHITINLLFVIILIAQIILTILNLYPEYCFLLFYVPIGVINIFDIIRGARYGSKLILNEEEIILNEITGDNDWNKISSNYILTEDFMLKYKKYLNWDLIIINQKLKIKFIEKMWDHIKTNNCMWHITWFQKLPKKFLAKYESDFQNFFNEKTFIPD